MRLLAISAVSAAALLGAPALAQSAIVGTWAATAETPQGTFETTMIVTEGDGAYDVTFEDPAPPGGAGPMESEISDVAAEGDSLTFKRTLTTPQGPFELTYDITVDGDTFTGTAASAFGPVPFSGTRK